MKIFLPFALSLLLAACGGGGSTPSGGTAPVANAPQPAPPTASTGLSISFSAREIAFDAVEGREPHSKVMTASASGTTDKDLLMGAQIGGVGIRSPIDIDTNTTTRTASISIAHARGLPPGVHTGDIKMMACTTQDCSVHHAGSPHNVSYTVTVHAALKPSPSMVTLVAAETGTSTAKDIAFTPPGGNRSVGFMVRYTSAGSGWLTAEIIGNMVRVHGSAALLKPGVYDADLVLNSTLQEVTVPVQFKVGTALTIPDSAALKVDSSSAAVRMQGTIPMAFAPGSPATQWSAVSDQPWLKVIQGSGAVGIDPAWRIDVSAFALLANNQHHKALVRITPNGGLAARSFTLDVHKALAEIKGLDSLAVLEGQAGDLLVYGTGFDALSGVAAVTVAGAQHSSVSILSDRVLRVSLAPMTKGKHAVSLNAASGMTVPAKDMFVVPRITYGYQALDTSGKKQLMIWDSVSQSAFVINSTSQSLMRYAPVAGTFQLVTSRNFPDLDSIGLTPDRSSLVLQSATKTLFKLSPSDLSTTAAFKVQPTTYIETRYALRVPLSIMGDNRMLHQGFGWIDLDTGVTAPVAFASRTLYDVWQAAWGAPSGNGMRMLWPDSGTTTPRSPMLRTDLVTGNFSALNSTLAPFFYTYSVNRDGTKWVIYNQVVDFDLNVLGNYQFPDGWQGSQPVISRSGARLYSYAQSKVKGMKPRVFVWDTSQAIGSGASFPILGHIEFDDLPNCPYDPYLSDTPACDTFGSKVAISDDEETLFIAGDKKFIVLPIPGGMRPAAPVRPGDAMIRARELIKPRG